MRPKTLRECGYSACHHPRWRVEPRLDQAPEPVDQPPSEWIEISFLTTCLFCGAFLSDRGWVGGSLDRVPDPLLLPPSWPLTPATDP